MFIKTVLHKGQGLGNQLWVYSVTRALAKFYDCDHVIAGLDNFKGADFLDIDAGNCTLINKECKLYTEKKYFDKELSFISTLYEPELFSLNESVNLVGLFQSEKYLKDSLYDVSSWIKINNNVACKVDQNYMSRYVLNIRGGEYKNTKSLLLGKEYWDNGINKLKDYFSCSYDDILIVTDDYRYAKALYPRVEILSNSISSCYLALHSSIGLVISNSSFSYFPIKTRNDKPFVIAPAYWARYSPNSNRWSMPTNYYSDWNWMDNTGEFILHDEAEEIVRHTEEYYSTYFNTMVKDDKMHGSPWTRYFPSVLKEPLRKIGSRIFPKSVG
jgi:hypothetical protein